MFHKGQQNPCSRTILSFVYKNYASKLMETRRFRNTLSYKASADLTKENGGKLCRHFMRTMYCTSHPVCPSAQPFKVYLKNSKLVILGLSYEQSLVVSSILFWFAKRPRPKVYLPYSAKLLSNYYPKSSCSCGTYFIFQLILLPSTKNICTHII